MAMDTESLVPEINAFHPELPIERAWMPPSSWYTSPGFYELDRQTVLRDHWVCVGRTDQVAENGSFFAGDFAQQPFVVLRDDEGVLRAFHNSCRHHAAAVAVGEGKCEELVCPYHGWRYRLNGELKSAPRVAGIEDFRREEFALPAIAVNEWGHLIFLHFGDNVIPPVDQDFEELDELLEETRTSDLQFVERREYEIRCNWKVFVDNYLDGGYHVPVLHNALTGQLDLDSYRTRLFSNWSVQTVDGTKSAAESKPSVDFAERIGSGATYVWIHPNIMLNRYGPILDTNLLLPLDENRTLVVIDYFFDPAVCADEDFVARSIAASHLVQEEDIMICESVQRGLESASYEKGRYAPSVEQGELHFHRLLATSYRNAARMSSG
jgi:choline monooxygenase